MDEGTYARPEVAALLNERFIPVKVDRDLSPDLDERFQREEEIGARLNHPAILKVIKVDEPKSRPY